MLRISLILIFIIMTSSCANTDDKIPSISNFKFGKIKLNPEGKWYVFEETMKLPLLIGVRKNGQMNNAKNIWGASFDYIGFDESKIAFVKMTPPGSVKCHKLEDEIPCYASEDNSVNLRLKMTPGSGHFCSTFHFTEGDPTGIWRFNLVISDIKIKEWELVVEPAGLDISSW